MQIKQFLLFDIIKTILLIQLIDIFLSLLDTVVSRIVCTYHNKSNIKFLNFK